MPKEQKWDVGYYADADGWEPVSDFLRDVRQSNPDAAATVHRKFRIFAQLGWIKSVENGLLKHVEEKIFEVKVKGGQPRVLGFAWHGFLVVASAEMKDQDELDPKTIKDAQDRRVDWVQRKGE